MRILPQYLSLRGRLTSCSSSVNPALTSVTFFRVAQGVKLRERRCRIKIAVVAAKVPYFTPLSLMNYFGGTPLHFEERKFAGRFSATAHSSPCTDSSGKIDNIQEKNDYLL